MLPRTDVGDKEENLMMSKYKLIIDITKNMMQIDSIVVSLKPSFFFENRSLKLPYGVYYSAYHCSVSKKKKAYHCLPLLCAGIFA